VNETTVVYDKLCSLYCICIKCTAGNQTISKSIVTQFAIEGSLCVAHTNTHGVVPARTGVTLNPAHPFSAALVLAWHRVHAVTCVANIAAYSWRCWRRRLRWRQRHRDELVLLLCRWPSFRFHFSICRIRCRYDVDVSSAWSFAASCFIWLFTFIPTQLG